MTLPNIGLTTPRLQLRAFAKARDLPPGGSQQVTMTLDKYAVSFWDTVGKVWSAKAGAYSVHVGTSSDDLPLKETFELMQGFEWSGL